MTDLKKMFASQELQPEERVFWKKRGRKKCFIMFVIPTVETGKEPQNESQMTTQNCWRFNLPRKKQ